MKTQVRKGQGGVISVTLQTAEGERTVSTGCTTKREAEKVIRGANIHTIEDLAKRQALSQALIQKLVLGGKVTVSTALDEWEAWLRGAANSDRTADNHVLFARAWARDMRLLTKDISAVTVRDINDWINEEGDAKWSTRKVHLVAVRSLFQFCSIRQYITGNPALEARIKAKLLTHEQKETGSKVPFTEAEIKKIVAYLDARIRELAPGKSTPVAERKLQTARFWRAATLLGRYSGLRLGDICSLEWACFNEAGKMNVWTDKRDTRISLPVYDELADAIASIPPNNRRLCFPEQDAAHRHPSKRSKLCVQFGRILEACGIHGKSFHCLRVALASELNAKGTNIEEIAKALGHRSKESTAVYIKAYPEQE